MARPSVRYGFNSSIHGARGLFAAMVFIFHVVNSGLPTFSWLQDSPFEYYVLRSFKFGVELFFGISGFVILAALTRAPSIRSFLWDRATRIFPLLWITLIAILVMSLILGRWLPPLADLLLNFLAPPPLFHLPQLNPAAWSLGYEVSFYLLCAAAWHMRQRLTPGWRALAIAGAAVLIAFFPRAILMPAGLVIAAGLLDRPMVRRLTVMPGLLLILFLVGWRAIETATTGDMMALTPLRGIEAFTAAPFLILAGGVGCFALYGIAQGKGWIGSALKTPLFQWLGTISYSFYLWHPVVMGAAKAALAQVGAFEIVGEYAQLFFMLATLPLALVVAHFSQIWIELKLTRLLRRVGPVEGSGKAPLAVRVDAERGMVAP